MQSLRAAFETSGFEGSSGTQAGRQNAPAAGRGGAPPGAPAGGDGARAAPREAARLSRASSAASSAFDAEAAPPGARCRAPAPPPTRGPAAQPRLPGLGLGFRTRSHSGSHRAANSRLSQCRSMLHVLGYLSSANDVRARHIRPAKGFQGATSSRAAGLTTSNLIELLHCPTS